jgi:ligand-binding sensor domain-containing protein
MSRKNILGYAFLIFTGQFSVGVAQEIPLGTWRMHASFNAINSVDVSTSKVYAASGNSVMIVDQSDNSLSAITSLDGLSSTNITQVTIDEPRQQLLVAYADGDLDIVRSDEIINFNRLKNSTTIPGSKRINHITVQNDVAYLSTDYGLVVFDLEQLEVRETFRDLGTGGSQLKILQSTIYKDSLFLATEKGVLAGDPDDNLLDFNNWKRFNSGSFSGPIQSITAFNNDVFVAVNSSGIYRYLNGGWDLQSYLQNQTFKNLTAGSIFLMITEGSSLWKLSTTDVLTAVTDEKIINPLLSQEDNSGKLWIGDQRNGLISDKTGNFERYIPNGPSFPTGLRIKYDMLSNKVFIVSGGESLGQPLLRTEYLNYFLKGQWGQEIDFANEDLTDVETVGNRLILSSFGKGVQVIENGAVIFEDETTCPKVSALASSTSGVWVTNYGSTQSLYLLKNDNSWEAFSFNVSAARFPTEIAVDYLGRVWMLLNPANGGGIFVFDKATNQQVYLTDAKGVGGLPSRNVYSIEMDRNGQVWVGTASGVAYYPNPSSIFNGGVNAVIPIFERGYLLHEEKVLAIETDGGNRKWMGTERGAWLFDPIGETNVHYFNATNSPLPDDQVKDIEVNQQTGEVFLMTQTGIISYRSDATVSDGTFHNLKIFPNPVTANFNGLVSISGLATDAMVKITDVTGKLIWQTYANGGTASWNVRDYNGNRAATGMYLLISTSQDGSESVIGKIAVVN